MSLQDNYFDVAAALEGKPEAVLFEEIWTDFCSMEEEITRLRKELVDSEIRRLAILDDAYPEVGMGSSPGDLHTRALAGLTSRGVI